jgi:hypothetical protein
MKRKILLLPIMALLFGTLLAAFPATMVYADAAPAWRDTGVTVQEGNYYFDAVQPDLVIKRETANGTPRILVANLNTGQTNVLRESNFVDYNSATGYLYGQTADYKFVRFSTRDPQGVILPYKSAILARDGSLWVYVFSPENPRGKFLASNDGGLTWAERSRPDNIWQVVNPASDGQALYSMTRENTATGARYKLYFSSDAGTSWESRWERFVEGNAGSFPPQPRIEMPFGRVAPANVIMLATSQGAGSNGSTTYEISFDYGRTFTQVGIGGKNGGYRFFYTNEGLLRLATTSSGSVQMEVSGDAKTWNSRSLPFIPDAYNVAYGGANIKLIPSENSGLNFLYSADGDPNVYFTPDAGRSWQKLGAKFDIMQFSPYASTRIYGINKDGKVHAMNLPQADKGQTASAPVSNARNSLYFEQTRHNISPLFTKFWTDNGGLAQFGYPKTEAFREYNPADGKIYLVQYFERNRFEYHPELAGTKYEVLLGLLGNQQTEKYRAEKHGAFNYFEDKKYPGGIYFPETGHNLRNTFKDYWEKNGGLAIYGYPTSEEFYEVNPDDGKTYVVQYFERNRFEWHPENKGTRYEVLLGLLGNALLRDKGWLQ